MGPEALSERSGAGEREVVKEDRMLPLEVCVMFSVIPEMFLLGYCTESDCTTLDNVHVLFDRRGSATAHLTASPSTS